ncbi:MAG TPA: hypothetical protein VJ890_09935 [Vineibacter sp.]|nr:hypothetical protein [Vineibacter sp.]
MTVGGPSRPKAASLSDQVAAWERIVAQVEAGYAFGLDDWLNDMDLRRRIEEAIEGIRAVGGPISPSERIPNKQARVHLSLCDKRFRRATVATDTCTWGTRVAAREGWRADRQWWYFRRPRRSNASLDREIADVR